MTNRIKSFLWLAIAAIVFSAAPFLYQSLYAQQPTPLLTGSPGGIGETNLTSVTITGALTGIQSFGIVTATSAGAITLTTDTATALCAVIGRSSTDIAGVYWDLYIKQAGAGSVNALLPGTGVTVTGTATVAAAAVRHFRAFPTSCAAGLQAVTFLSLETTAF
jgi:hypothetical protein